MVVELVLQESDAALISKTITVDVESSATSKRGHLLWNVNNDVDCFAIDLVQISDPDKCVSISRVSCLDLWFHHSSVILSNTGVLDAVKTAPF